MLGIDKFSGGGINMNKIFKLIFITLIVGCILPLGLQAIAPQYTISGQILGDGGREGIDGVYVEFSDGGTPQSVTTSGGGYYSLSVASGWTGTVTPDFPCHTFTPASANIGPVTGNVTQDFEGSYTPAVLSGIVSDGPPVYDGEGILTNPIVGVLISLSTGGSALSNTEGAYSITANCGAEATVTPTKVGWNFTPASRYYESIDGSIWEQDYQGTASDTTYTISGTVTGDGGRVGIDGVTVTFFDGVSGHTEVTSGGGLYSYTVPENWTGTVTPILAGYAFTPEFAAISPVTSNVTRDFMGSVALLTIAGMVTDGSFNPIAGITVRLSTGGDDVTGGGGTYSFEVPYGWSGSITPSTGGAGGWAFEPRRRTYNNLTASQAAQNFMGTRRNTRYTISGIVTANGVGLEGVVLNGLPGPPTTDISGNYSAEVTYGYSDTVTPSLAGYIFSPASLTYTDVTSNQTNQNYSALSGNPVISGAVTTPGGVGISGVSLAFSDDGGTVTTDENGDYSNTVPSGWSGTVVPSKDGYLFSPADRIYGAVTAEQTGQDYVSVGSPVIVLNPTQLNFGADISGNVGIPQLFTVSNGGGGTLNWAVTADQGWIAFTPASGMDSGAVTVSVDASGLGVGTYSGVITVTDPNAGNSPQTVSVVLEVYGDTAPPFGIFNTPVDGSTVQGSVPVTGWVLDDIGVENVKIYRANNGGLVFIGDAVFVEGARPDVELMYPDYPNNSRAGWGYMLLTNFLPDGGNGTYTLHAIAMDSEGNEVTLDTRTFTCDNVNAVKPFGAIDTPDQGGEISGGAFRNHGWVLTPMPNMISIDGSTIDVFVDGVNIGKPVYNIYRVDVASMFPGYANSDGAHAYFDFDTTVYADGVHTIYWTATDDAGNTDGIGSRFFTIQNGAANGVSAGVMGIGMEALGRIPFDGTVSLGFKKGYREDVEPQVQLDGIGVSRVGLRVSERMEVRVPGVVSGGLLVGDGIRNLPIGSTLDIDAGMFYWLPAAGFSGEFHLVFVLKDQNGELKRKEVIVTIEN